MWRSARPMPVKNEKPTTMEATDSSNMRENKCETIPVVIRRRRKKGEKKKIATDDAGKRRKKKIATDDAYVFLCDFIMLRALSHQ